MTSSEQRLATIRGDTPPRRHNARTIAALTGNPGCTRRAVLDGAGVDKPLLAERIGFPARFGQSRFAITRGNVFEAQVKADGGAELLRLVAERLGVPVPAAASWTDLGGRDDVTGREERSAALLTAALTGPAPTGTETPQADPAGGTDAAALFDHPLLGLDVAGRRVYLEPDLVAARLGGRFHVVEVKSFAVIDGQADPAKLAAAAVQSAVYVLALRELLAAGGHDPRLVSHEVVLVCPADFTNRPVAHLIDVRKQLLVVRRQLDRMDQLDVLLTGVPADFTADPADDATALVDSLARVRANYAPDCLASCELAYFCRHEAGGQTGTLGRPVREALGGIDDIDEVLALAGGDHPADPERAEAAALLRTAARLRADALGTPA
ncbi:hypothetical protein [Micromonospora endophytica]|uniref:Uncharacterized protein n=1 Tax=Micromonospora endophytica TaxID=515350 RepID=A0A2W2CQU7_9ACTN|nr:hypothetical protein [Micromonospora endophytica]PZF90487.1 hypothetical protein C1I93_22620 [Micromonospora endophytica]RIW50861.1 hypothetical protein D3H59_01760 [Micromonospora endophytica]BCJ58357.1 hypothetical protein Jiend_17790 [Micromonospora endophytica]